ncbi:MULTISPECIES: hypothetical protein [Pseudomonas]|uniref:Uncharacterized protein n=1 Tax=Pseudomonas gingeri TaxID=117681 RepID=A0A7Y7WBV3_9PSED|nr:hypothetical protein [Pseudomonas gingeri]NWB46518.1 hypothetical protein [Pseudomonas gingeri]
MNDYDKEFTTWLNSEKISYETIEQSKHDKLIYSINRAFPFSGSKIDWSKTKNSLSFNTQNKDKALLAISQKAADSTSKIIFIGDSLIHLGYKIKNTDILSVLAEVFEIPQHNYIFPQDLSWIACLSMEGDIDMGDSPIQDR